MSDSVITNNSSVVADDLPTVLLMIDHNGRVIEVCGVQKALYGFMPSELYGRKISEFIHEEIPGHLLNTCKQMFSAGRAWRGAIKCRTKSGGHCWNDVYLSPRWQSGSLSGAWLTLSPCEPHVVERAQGAYRRTKKRRRGYEPHRGLIISTALIGLVVTFLFFLTSTLAFTVLLGLSLSLAALVLGRVSLNGEGLTHSTGRGHIDPLMCYIYTGGSNTSCMAAYTLALRELENTSLAAWVSHRCDILDRATRHQQSRISHLDAVTHQQQQQTHLIRQSLRGMLDDQHRTACAATRSKQLIQESQQDAIQSRVVFHRLGHVHRQHLGRLQRIHNHLQTLAGHHHQIIGLIDQLCETTEEMHFVAHRHPSWTDENSTTVIANQGVHQLAKSASVLLQDLHSAARQWSVTVRNLMSDIEASMQDAQQHFTFVHDGDNALQSVINVMSRLNSLISDIESAVHQQSIARAAVTHHTESLEKHITSIAQTSRDIGAGIERTGKHLDSLRLQPQGSDNH